MNDDRPIKMHLDEKMRAHIAFVLRRYRNDRLRDWNHLGLQSISDDINITDICLKEADEAGT